MPKARTVGSERAALPPRRAAALKKWLRVANSRLLLIQHQRQQLLATATTLTHGLEQRSERSVQKPPKLAMRLAKAAKSSA